MTNQGNDVPSELRELAQYIDEKHPDATVLIDNNPQNAYNDLLISVCGDDQDEVSTLATKTIASEVRNHPLMSELDGAESVRPTVTNDEESLYEYEVTVRVWQ